MTDAALWNTWRTERDPDAFARIAARYAGLVFGTCLRVLRNRADAEDASQECFLELLRIDPPDLQSFGAFLHTLAVRRSLDLAKRGRRRGAREERYAREKPAASGVSAHELTECVDAAIAELPDDLRAPLVERFLEGATYEEVALRHGLPESTARHRVRKGIAALRPILARRGVTLGAGALAASLGGLAAEAAPTALLAQMGKLALAGAASAAPAAKALPQGAVIIGALVMKKTHVIAVLAILAAIIGTVLVHRGLSTPSSRDAVSAIPPDAAARNRSDERAGAGPLETAVPPGTPPVGAVLAGSVRDAGSGGPLAGARLQAGGLETTSDAAGRFSLAGLPAGPVELAVSLRGFVGSRRPVELREGGESAADVALEPALEVLVENESGEALEGAEVYLHESSDTEPKESAHGPFVTGVDGKTFIDSVPRMRRGAAVSRAVFARGGGEPMLTGIAVQRLGPAEDGSPLPPPSPLRVVLLDSILVAGRVEVPPGRDPRDVVVSVLYVAIRDPRSFLGPSLARHGSGGNRPWPELFEVHPRADGRFALAWVPRASVVTVQANGPGLAQATLRSEDPLVLADLVLSLAPEGAIEGTLVFEDKGAPAGGRRLVALPMSVARESTFAAEVGLDGRFRFDALPADAYRLALPHDADRSEWTLGVREPVLVGSGETVRGIELRLERGAIVRGRVTETPAGKPVAGVWVSAVQGSNEPSVPVGGAATDEDGRYEVRLPGGRTTVYLSSLPPGFRRIRGREERVVDIEAGSPEPAGIDFELSPGEEPLPAFLRSFDALGHAAGRVVDPSGAPIAHAAIEAHRQWQLEDGEKDGPWVNPTHRAFTDEDGRYRVPVAAGKPYKLLAARREYGTEWSEVFRVEEEGEHAVTDIRLVRGTSSLEGVVVDADGTGIEGAQLFASSTSKESRSSDDRVATDAQGRFRVEHLIEGELVSLGVVRAGYETRKWSFAPGSSDLRLVLHRTTGEDGGTGEKAGQPKSLPDPRGLIGRGAPRWTIDRWVREPLAPALLDRPARSDGKTTVVVLALEPSDPEASRARAAALDALCERHDAAAVMVFSSAVDESVIRPLLDGMGPRVAAGIDRHVPRSEYGLSDATHIAYGYAGSPTIIVVEPGGTVTHVVHDLEGLEKALRR